MSESVGQLGDAIPRTGGVSLGSGDDAIGDRAVFGRDGFGRLRRQRRGHHGKRQGSENGGASHRHPVLRGELRKWEIYARPCASSLDADESFGAGCRDYFKRLSPSRAADHFQHCTLWQHDQGQRFSITHANPSLADSWRE